MGWVFFFAALGLGNLVFAKKNPTYKFQWLHYLLSGVCFAAALYNNAQF